MAPAVLLALIALRAMPMVLAYTHHHHVATSRGIRSSSALYEQKQNDSYSSMPPLYKRPPAHGNIFKIFRRNVYPTVDLPSHEDDSYELIDHYFMGMALQQAQYAWSKGEVPIGAVIVREFDIDDEGEDTSDTLPTAPKRTFQILSASHNRVETNIDASAHAELLALRQGARNLNNWRFPPNSRLYDTLEPCPMCLASIQAFRIDHVVYGAPDNRLGAIKTHMNLLKMAKHPYHEVKSVTSGIREEECGDIIVQFFREQRRKKKEMKSGRSLLKLPLKKTPVKDQKRQSRWSSLINKLLRRE